MTDHVWRKKQIKSGLKTLQTVPASFAAKSLQSASRRPHYQSWTAEKLSNCRSWKAEKIHLSYSKILANWIEFCHIINHEQLKNIKHENCEAEKLSIMKNWKNILFRFKLFDKMDWISPNHQSWTGEKYEAWKAEENTTFQTQNG